jgi:membrane-bound ClpP family serine protease
MNIIHKNHHEFIIFRTPTFVGVAREGELGRTTKRLQCKFVSRRRHSVFDHAFRTVSAPYAASILPFSILGVAVLGVAVLGVAVLGVAVLGVAVLGVAVLGVAVLGVAVLGVAVLGVAVLGVAVLGVAVLGVAVLGVTREIGQPLGAARNGTDSASHRKRCAPRDPI